MIKKIPKKFSEKKKIPKKNFFLDFFFQIHEMAGIFTKLCLKQNHEIAGITNCEITKCGDSLYYVFCINTSSQNPSRKMASVKSSNFLRVCRTYSCTLQELTKHLTTKTVFGCQFPICIYQYL